MNCFRMSGSSGGMWICCAQNRVSGSGIALQSGTRLRSRGAAGWGRGVSFRRRPPPRPPQAWGPVRVRRSLEPNRGPGGRRGLLPAPPAARKMRANGPVQRQPRPSSSGPAAAIIAHWYPGNQHARAPPPNGARARGRSLQCACAGHCACAACLQPLSPDSCELQELTVWIRKGPFGCFAAADCDP